MEIDVTHIINDHVLTDFSDSRFNSGRDDIGEITWNNALTACGAMSAPLCPNQAALRDWVQEFGAWSHSEIEAMSDLQTNALLLQFVAGDGQSYLAAQEEGRLGDYLE